MTYDERRWRENTIDFLESRGPIITTIGVLIMMFGLLLAVVGIVSIEDPYGKGAFLLLGGLFVLPGAIVFYRGMVSYRKTIEVFQKEISEKENWRMANTGKTQGLDAKQKVKEV